MFLFLRNLFILGLLACAGGLLGGCKKEARVLTVFIWPDYIAPNVVSRFEKEANCTVRLEYFTTNDELREKLLYGETRPDVIVPSSYELGFYAQLDLIEQLDEEQLPLVKANVSSRLFDIKAYKPLKSYGVPYFAAPTGLAYLPRQNEPDIPPEAASWSLLDSPSETSSDQRKNTLLSDRREVFAIALMSNGHDPNSTNTDELEDAAATIGRWKAHGVIDGTSYIPKLLGNQSRFAHAYMGDVLPHKGLRFLLPKEGYLVTYDCLAVPKDAPHKKLAMEFINYLAREDVCAENMAWTNFLAPNQAALRQLVDQDKDREAKPSESHPGP
jgi:spermidine/putrescine transport system substrate-binding protein